METKTYEQLDEIAIKIINLLADNKVCIRDIDCLFDKVHRIICLETEVKRIDN